MLHAVSRSMRSSTVGKGLAEFPHRKALFTLLPCDDHDHGFPYSFSYRILSNGIGCALLLYATSSKFIYIAFCGVVAIMLPSAAIIVARFLRANGYNEAWALLSLL